jgi:hypothetical protein
MLNDCMNEINKRSLERQGVSRHASMIQFLSISLRDI